MNEQTKPGGPALASPAPLKTSLQPLRLVKTLDDAFRNQEFMDRIAASVPEHVKPQRMLRTFIMATSTNPQLTEASLRSFLGACLTTSQLGLEPNTPLGESYLIPFKVNKWNPKTKDHEYVRTDITFIPGYRGLLSLSYRTRQVVSVHADVVWKEDLEARPDPRFSFEYGTDAHLRHTPLHVPKDPENDIPVFAYAHAKLVDGQAFLVWPWEQVMQHRQMSQGYRSALAAYENARAKGWRVPATWTEAPWVKHRNAMGRKTMVRAISSMLPRSIEMASAVHLDQIQDRRSINWESVLNAPTIDGTPDYIGKAVEEADIQSRRAEEEESQVEGAAGGAGATFTDRRPDTVSTSATSNEAAKSNVPPVDKGAQQQTPTTATKQQQPAPVWGDSFEAVLVDAYGEGGEVFADAVTYAQALIELWQDAAVGPDAAAVLEHNADGIEAARAHPDAAAILARLDEPPTESRDDTPPLSFSAIEVPNDRGKLQWPAWLAAIKQALAGLPPRYMPEWLEAQRETIGRSPVSQRPLAIRAIATTMGSAGHTPPDWLASMQPPSRASREASAAATKAQASPPATSTPEPPAAETPSATDPKLDADHRWAIAMKADIDRATSLAQINEFIGTGAIRTKMARLQRDNPALFADVQAAFQAGLDRYGAGNGDPGPETAR